MIAEHLPALQVVVPLIAAPLAVLARHAGLAWVLAMASALSSLGVSLALLSRVIGGGYISYALGSWAPPWGIEYRVDAANAFVLVLVSLIAVFVVPYARRSVEIEVPREQHYLFYAMLCLCLAGLLGMAITGDAFNFFVFLEISSLATYVLVALGRDRRALVAAYQYLILGTVGATFIVIGVGLLYITTGTLNMVDIAQRLPEDAGHRPVLAALAFLTVGICLKLALFPLHAWLPNAYAYAPSAVAALLAGTATKVSIYALLRFYFTVFGQRTVVDSLPMEEILLVLSVAAMFIASAIAVFQNDLKRMLAYSSVGQIGYITLGISFASQTGLTAAVAHLFNHGITKATLFMLVGGIAARAGSVSFDRLAGIAQRMPLTCAGIVLGGMSLVGVPSTAGFVTKWYLVIAAVERDAWVIAMLPVASSLIALAYMYRFVEVAYLRQPGPALADVREAPAAMLVPALGLAALVVASGVYSTPVVDGAAAAARALLEGVR
ncbi:MAG: monovalent cation/H+ antiporter subunit D family protein [Burkholderiales bacterium]